MNVFQPDPTNFVFFERVDLMTAHGGGRDRPQIWEQNAEAGLAAGMDYREVLRGSTLHARLTDAAAWYEGASSSRTPSGCNANVYLPPWP